MITRHQFKMATIKERIACYEAERRQLLRMVETSQVDLAWLTERWDAVHLELRLLQRDLARAQLEMEEGA
jgi:hypothetical protein